MPVNIIEVDPAEHTEADKHALAEARKWLARIEEFFITPRSHQKQIGISEVGSDCRKCVARKLAQRPKSISGGWFPHIGTAVHDALERGFTERYPDEYKLENRLHVPSYKGLEFGG